MHSNDTLIHCIIVLLNLKNLFIHLYYSSVIKLKGFLFIYIILDAKNIVLKSNANISENKNAKNILERISNFVLDINNIFKINPLNYPHS